MTGRAGITPEALVAGPRGRRLCLEIAASLRPEVAEAVGAAIGSAGRGRPEPPGDRIARLAGLLASGPAPRPTAAATRLALERAVDFARYWQEPDDEDRLAAEPAVRPALVPVARAVLAAPGTDWWAAGRADEQWRIHWGEDGPAAAAPARPTVAEWTARTRAEEERARRERPADPRAPWSGHWWSVPVEVPATVGHLPAALGLVEDELGWQDAVTVPTGPAGRTLEIRTGADWVALCREFPLEVTASRRHDWFRATGRAGRWVIPDWSRVAEDWDAVHLTVLGYLTAAGRALDVQDGVATVIAGWNPDSTLRLRPADVPADGPDGSGSPDGPAGRRWHRDPDTGDWAPARS